MFHIFCHDFMPTGRFGRLDESWPVVIQFNRIAHIFKTLNSNLINLKTFPNWFKTLSSWTSLTFFSTCFVCLTEKQGGTPHLQHGEPCHPWSPKSDSGVPKCTVCVRSNLKRKKSLELSDRPTAPNSTTKIPPESWKANGHNLTSQWRLRTVVQNTYIKYVLIFSKQHTEVQLFTPGTKIEVIVFFGGHYRFTVFRSNQH